MPLLICRTCPRYDTCNTGAFGRSVTAAIAAAEPDSDTIDIRNVACLGGCPRHGVAAVDGPGKARIRFTSLDTTDAEALIAAAIAHNACDTGAPEDWPIPTPLANRISSITRKRPPRNALS